jgi:hypothetical protein
MATIQRTFSGVVAKKLLFRFIIKCPSTTTAFYILLFVKHVVFKCMFVDLIRILVLHKFT